MGIAKITGAIQRAKKALGKTVGLPRLSAQEIDLLTKEKYPNATAITLDFGKNDLRRTIYTFIKFFDLAKVNLNILKNNMFFAEMKSDQYGKWALEEALFKISNEKPIDARVLTFNGKLNGAELSDDYFHFDKDAYYFPITQHPIMYQQGYWNEKVETTTNSRIRIPFFAGSFGIETYKRLKSNDVFQVENRNDLINYLVNNHTVKWIESENDLGKTFSADVLISDTTKFQIPASKLRSTLAKYAFFFAFPGASVPHCHNLAEALSVGCIPIIQSGYANLVYPKMKDGLNAFIYDSVDEIPSIFDKASTMDEEKIEEMTKEVTHYYNTYYTPSAVVNNILDPSIKKIKVISFSSSIKYLHK